MEIAFRVDGGGDSLGLGHLVRCLAIAEALKERYKTHIRFICRDYPKGIQLIQSHHFSVDTIPPQCNLEEDLCKSIALINDADIVIADSYTFNTEYLRRLKNHRKIVAIDDMMDRDLPVDVVIGNAYATREDYGSKIAKETILLSGPDYLPLRKEFQQISERSIPDELSTVLITFGGEDPQNVTQHVVESIATYPKKLSLKILIGAAYPHSKSLERALEQSRHPYEVYCNIPNVLPLFQQCDVAITAAGTTVWELAACGIPMLIIQSADNQTKVVEYVRQKELGVFLGRYDCISSYELNQGLQKLENKQIRVDFSRHSQHLVDGKGADRIAEALIGIELRRPDPDPGGEHSRLIWLWRNDPITRQMSRNSNVTPWKSHQSWYTQTLQNPKKVLLIAYQGGTAAGMVRFDFLEPAYAEININLNPTLRGKGLGHEVLKSACQYGFNQLHLKRIYAEIKMDNTASIHIFEDLGFVLAGLRGDLLTYNLQVEGGR